MHPMVKHLVNSIADNKPIDWNEVHKELDRITISEREKLLCRNLHTIYKVMMTRREGCCGGDRTTS